MSSARVADYASPASGTTTRTRQQLRRDLGQPATDAPAARGAVAEARAAVWTLALSAGIVVSVCFLEFSRIEVGPMTGNTINAGGLLHMHAYAATVIRIVVIVAFVVGIAAGITIAEECARRHRRRTLAMTLAVEVAFLVLFTVLALGSSRSFRFEVRSSAQLAALAALPAIAMGLQTAALRRVRGQTVRTVYISGMLTRWAEEAVRYAYWRRDRRTPGTAAPWRNEPTIRRLFLLGSIVAWYAIGAFLGAWLDTEWQLRALVVPIGMLCILVVVDVVVASGPPAR